MIASGPPVSGSDAQVERNVVNPWSILCSVIKAMPPRLGVKA